MLRRSLRWKKRKSPFFAALIFIYGTTEEENSLSSWDGNKKIHRDDEGDGLSRRGGSKFSSRNYLHGGNGLRHKIDLEQFLMKAKARQKILSLVSEREILFWVEFSHPTWYFFFKLFSWRLKKEEISPSKFSLSIMWTQNIMLMLWA